MSVLGQQTSHLFLIRTNLGYGTVLTAACTNQGCSAADYYNYYSQAAKCTMAVLVIEAGCFKACGIAQDLRL
jgi:hypothetical protein